MSDWRKAEIVKQSWQDAPIVEREEKGFSPLDIAKGVGEATVSTVGNVAAMPAAGLAGINTALSNQLGSAGAAMALRDMGYPERDVGEFMPTDPATTVRNVQETVRTALAPQTEAGRAAEDVIAKTAETGAKVVKYPLSAIPFALGGSEERQEFMETPLGDYLGELAQDSGASPLVATLAHISPEVLAMAAGGALMRRGKSEKTTVPSVDDLKTEASRLYDLVDNSGIRISDNSFAKAVSDITEDALSKGARQSLTPKTWAALNELGEEAAKGGLTLKKAEELRRVIKKAQNATDQADMASATRALRKWDEYIENVKAKDLSELSGAESVQYLKSARSLWSRARKTEVIEDMIDTAQLNAGMFSGSGYENALRTQFRALARNKKKMRMFTPDEQAAIRRVATGGPMENMLRYVGKAAPTGIVSAGLGSGAGFMIGGPTGAFIVPAVGGLARKLATRSTIKNAEKASETMRLGRSPETR